MNTRTSRPSDLGSIRHGQRIPGADSTNELLADLKKGDTSQIEGGEVPPVVPPPDISLEVPEEVLAGNDNAEPAASPTPTMSGLPESIVNVLNSKARTELIAVAEFLDPSNNRKRSLIFHTPIGDVKCDVDWTSHRPEDMFSRDQLILIKVSPSDVQFAPNPGASMDISLEGSDNRIGVTCVAPRMQLYPGVDLLCFLPQNAVMEKNGKLADDAPSVVSGEPSDTLSNEEPVAEGEKAASAKEFDAAKQAVVPTEDFDKVRT